jgi:hypothetical protein
MNRRSTLTPRFLTVALAALAFFSACAKKSGPDQAANGSAAAHDHNFPAPHGGTLVELGNHLYLLELVHDRDAGKLTGYILDAHAENFIRSPLAAIDLVVNHDGATTPLSLIAVANSATGETVGNSAEFAAEADWLKTTAPLNITIPILMFRGATFTDITARLEK